MKLYKYLCDVVRKFIISAERESKHIAYCIIMKKVGELFKKVPETAEM